MNVRFPLPFAALVLLGLVGCASAPRPGTAMPSDAEVVTGTAAQGPSDGPAVPAPTDPAPVVDAPVEGDATATADLPVSEAEDDYAALYGDAAATAGTDPAAAAYDPWEPMNRRIHAFNNVVDRGVARPLARAYVAVVPQPVRLGVTNFFDNLGSPLTMVNQLLQGRPRDAVQTLGRFVVNSTLGIGGVFDPASDLKMKRRSEDFGQTLGTWGWRRSRYVELPFFGPRTLRDVFGLAGDYPLSATRQVDDDTVRYGLQGLQLVDTRAQLLSIDSLREGAADDYVLVRDAWLQRRNYQIQMDLRRTRDDELPDYLRDEDERDPMVPAGAMPIPGG